MKWLVLASPGIFDSHGPCRAMADDRLFLETSDGIIAHAIEIIVTIIVLAHMVHAEAEIFPLTHAPHWCAVITRLRAAGMVAARLDGSRGVIGRRLHADAVKYARIQVHDTNIMGASTGRQQPEALITYNQASA